MKILAIGNSFSQDATRYLEAISDGQLFVRNLYIGGCPLSRHAENAKTGEAAYEYQQNADCLEKIALGEALKREAWDWVTVQQASPASGVYQTYEPYLSEVLDFVRQLCPTAKVAFHRTWPYDADCPIETFYKRYEGSSEVMFRAACEASAKAAAAHDLPIIPSGNAVWAAVNDGRFTAETSMYRDGYHLSLTYGRYLAGLCWYRFFTGNDPRTVTYVPENTDAALSDILKTIAATVEP